MTKEHPEPSTFPSRYYSINMLSCLLQNAHHLQEQQSDLEIPLFFNEESKAIFSVFFFFIIKLWKQPIRFTALYLKRQKIFGPVNLCFQRDLCIALFHHSNCNPLSRVAVLIHHLNALYICWIRGMRRRVIKFQTFEWTSNERKVY